jgi:glycosyltransferase involved in cell wall biosynthesis
MKKLSIVIPVFNEGSLIIELIKRVKINAEQITQDYEIVLVDDGSNDTTWQMISDEASLDKRIKGIKFSRNFGHHYAITAGLHQVSGEWTVVMDGDLQDRPEVIPELYGKAQEGFDVVFVSRKNRPEKIYYKLAQKIFYLLLRNLSGVDFDSRQANFSIINSKVVEAFRQFPENARFYGSTIKWLGFRRTQIFADHGIRLSGTPSYTLKKRIKLALDIVIAFSDRPLKFAIGLGIFISISSLAIGFYIAYRVIFDGYTTLGWEIVLAAMFFLAGIILTVGGIFGTYLGRIFDQVKDRPLFVVSEKIN